MKPTELVEAIKDANPKILGKISDKKAAQIINAALAQINLEIVTTSEGKVRVPRLGTFVVKTLEREKEGKKQTVSRVLFRAVQKKEKTA